MAGQTGGNCTHATVVRAAHPPLAPSTNAARHGPDHRLERTPGPGVWGTGVLETLGAFIAQALGPPSPPAKLALLPPPLSIH